MPKALRLLYQLELFDGVVLTSRGQCRARDRASYRRGKSTRPEDHPDPTSWILSVGGSRVHVELVSSDKLHQWAAALEFFCIPT
jgi:hypothetical protein